MTWTAVKTISLKTAWQYSDPVDGEYFRLKHSNASNGSYYQVAQAQFNSDNSIDFAGGQILEVGKEQEYDTLRLEKPGHFTDRRIAIRKIPQASSIETVMRSFLHSNLFRSDAAQTDSGYPSKWSVDVEVSDYVNEANSLTLSQLTDRFDVVNQKLVTIETKIDSIDTSGSGGNGTTTLDPNFSGVSLLLHFDGADGSTAFTDVKGNALTVAGTCKISNAQSKFGNSSGLFDGAGYLSLASSDAFNYGTNDFTEECWLLLNRLTEAAGDYQYMVIRSGATAGNVLAIRNGRIHLINDGTVYESPSSVVNAVNIWYHIAVTRTSGITRFFVNGSKVHETTISGSIGRTEVYDFGRYKPGNDSYLRGHLDEYRVTKGVGRYTADFTVSPTAFPNS